MIRSMSMLVLVILLATFVLAMINNTAISGQNTNSDQETVRQRKDVRHLPDRSKHLRSFSAEL
jgi:hypothetical protein